MNSFFDKLNHFRYKAIMKRLFTNNYDWFLWFNNICQKKFLTKVFNKNKNFNFSEISFYNFFNDYIS